MGAIGVKPTWSGVPFGALRWGSGAGPIGARIRGVGPVFPGVFMRDPERAWGTRPGRRVDPVVADVRAGSRLGSTSAPDSHRSPPTSPAVPSRRAANTAASATARAVVRSSRRAPPVRSPPRADGPRRDKDSAVEPRSARARAHLHRESSRGDRGSCTASENTPSPKHDPPVPRTFTSSPPKPPPGPPAIASLPPPVIGLAGLLALARRVTTLRDGSENPSAPPIPPTPAAAAGAAAPRADVEHAPAVAASIAARGALRDGDAAPSAERHEDGGQR